MNGKLHIVLATFAALNLAACAEEGIGGTIMPLGGLIDAKTEVAVEKMRKVKEMSGISIFSTGGPGRTVRVNGVADLSVYVNIGRKIHAMSEAAAPYGIKIVSTLVPTMNWGAGHPWRKFTFASGAVREFAVCPGDEGFRKDFAEKCAAMVREAKPFAHNFSDDFRYFGNGCFCDDHVKRFAALTGIERGRKALAKALADPSPVNDALRKTWHEFQTSDLLLLAKAAEEAIHGVSPSTLILCNAPGRFPERDVAKIARVLEGPHRPIVRWWGSRYGYDFPLEAGHLLHSAQWARENLGYDMECLYEADPCPHSRFYASASRMHALISTVGAMGFDAPIFYGLGSRKDAIQTSPDYLLMHGRDLARFDAVKCEAAKGRIVGVCPVFDPDMRLSASCADEKHPFDVKAWYRTLNCFGIPVTMAEAPVKLYAGHHAFRYMDDAAITNLLSGGVFLDGAAAEAITERGFASLIGVKATMRGKIDFTGEHLVTEGEPITFPCAFHQNYGLDGCAVSRLESQGAQNLTEFIGKGKCQPAITYFENELGGRVAVMAVNLADCKSSNVFNFRKRDLLVDLFRRLGGDRAVPARVIDRANVMLLANENDERMFLHATNLSCDPADSFVFEVVAPYAGGSVEILDGAKWVAADAKWDGGRVTVRPPSPVKVYGTLVLRIRSTVFTTDFSELKDNRAKWDLPVRFDLRRADGIAFDWRCSDTSLCAGFNVYLRSGGGWYTASFEPEDNAEWQRIVLRKSAFSRTEEAVGGWRDIDVARIGIWRGRKGKVKFGIANLAMLPSENPLVGIVRSDSCAGDGKFGSEREKFALSASVAAATFERLGIPVSDISDLELDDDAVKGLKLLVFPHNPRLPASAADTVRKFAAAGGKILACRTKDAALKEADFRFDRVWRLMGNDSLRKAHEVLLKVDPTWKPRIDAALESAERTFRSDVEYAAAQPRKSGEWRAFWIHEPFVNGKARDWDMTIRTLKERGFNAVLPNLAAAGCAYYRSSVFPAHPSVEREGDALDACLSACRKYGVECHAWNICWKAMRADGKFLERMRAEGRLQRAFDGGEHEAWLCPSHPANLALEVESFAELAAKGVDGVHFDYIRYRGPDFCFCDGCRARFEAKIGRKVEKWPADVRRDASLAALWKEFRCANISALVKTVSDRIRREHPEVKLSAAVFRSPDMDPDRVGQDWSAWCRDGLLDFACPMDYTDSCAAFRGQVLAQMDAVRGSKALLRPGIGLSCWLKRDRDAFTLARQIGIVRDAGLDGFCVFDLDARSMEATSHFAK